MNIRSGRISRHDAPGFQPRIRSWIDQNQDLHFGGEPLGFQALLEGVRAVYRGLRRRATVRLVAGAISADRNPVPQKVMNVFSSLVVQFSRSTEKCLLINVIGDRIQITGNREGLRDLYIAAVEAGDGEAGFCRQFRLMSAGTREGHIWFWGYSQKNSF